MRAIIKMMVSARNAENNKVAKLYLKFRGGQKIQPYADLGSPHRITSHL